MTTEALLKALARLRVETGSLACLGCGYEHNCSVHGCALLSEAWDKLDYLRRREDALYDEVKELWVEANSCGNALRAAEQKRAEAEDERDALLERMKKYRSCYDCKHGDYCEFDDANLIDCMNCVKKNCPCAQCCDSSRCELRGLPEAPKGGEKA